MSGLMLATDTACWRLLSGPGAPDAERFVRLDTGRDVDLDPLTRDRFDLDNRAQRRHRRRHVDRGDEVIAVADEAGVLAHPDQDIQVAGRSAPFAGVAAAADPDPLTVSDPGRDVHLDLGPLNLAAATPAHLARVAGDLPVAAAYVARGRPHDLAERSARDGAQLPRPLTAGARLDRRDLPDLRFTYSVGCFSILLSLALEALICVMR